MDERVMGGSWRLIRRLGFELDFGEFVGKV
jgi:hypothetical protein